MTHDDFATWDAAYVLGALSPTERRSFEEHAAGCDRCAAAVAELAGMPGLLARVPREQALALAEASPAPGDAPLRPVEDPGPGPEVLPSLMEHARRRRRRSRWVTATIAAAAAAVLVGVLALVLPAVIPAAHAPATTISMQQVEPSPLTASLSLTPEPWGTRVDSRCRYANVGGPYAAQAREYAMVVTDRQGRQTQVSTWTAAEGTVVGPVATTSVPVADIAAIDIRSDSGAVLLRSTFG